MTGLPRRTDGQRVLAGQTNALCPAGRAMRSIAGRTTRSIFVRLAKGGSASPLARRNFTRRWADDDAQHNLLKTQDKWLPDFASATSRFGGRFARHRRIIVRRCSHGAVSPCWREQRHESASTFRPCQDYNICETGSRLILAGLCLALVSAVVPAQAQVNVTQFHNHESRDGLYIDSAFTHSAAANLAR